MKNEEFKGITISISPKEIKEQEELLKDSFTYLTRYNYEDCDIQCKVIEDISYLDGNLLKSLVETTEQGKSIEKLIYVLTETETHFPVIGIQSRRGFFLYNPLLKHRMRPWYKNSTLQLLKKILQNGYLQERMVVGGGLDIRKFCDIIIDCRIFPKVIYDSKDYITNYELNLFELNNEVSEFVYSEIFDTIPLMNLERFIDKYHLYEEYKKSTP